MVLTFGRQHVQASDHHCYKYVRADVYVRETKCHKNKVQIQIKLVADVAIHCAKYLPWSVKNEQFIRA